MSAHSCPECGLMHDTPDHGESEAVRIAKINADRDIEVARLARSEGRLEAETELAIAETQAEAQVAEAIVEAETGVVAAEAVADALTPPEPEPQVVEVPAAQPGPDGTEEEVPAPQETGHRAPKKSGGYWDGYDQS